MKDSAEHVSEQCSEYETLQNRHLDLLKAEQLPDLAQMTIERRGASEKLKKAINEFISTADQSKFPPDTHNMATLKQRLGLILKVDETIGGEIQRHKKQLEKALNISSTEKQLWRATGRQRAAQALSASAGRNCLPQEGEKYECNRKCNNLYRQT